MPSASYQCKLAASLGRSLSRLRLSFPRASTMLLALVRSSTCSCAPASHPLLNHLARDSSLTLSPLSLSTSLSSSPLPSVPFSQLSLSTSLSSSPLPSVSPSQRTLTPEHARFNITSASSGRKHRGHSLPFLFFHPPTFPLGTAPCTA